MRVSPAFGKGLNEVECVYCGQCATCCPTGALTVKSEIDEVWKAINDPDKVVVVQIAPAVRTAVGESFGVMDGELAMGKTIAALRRIGFNRVYDTSFTADLTTMEEGTEFLKRLESGEKLPQFTSCCPAWVKFAEQFYPEFVANLSSCKSPQQMFGSLAKKYLPEELGVKPENLVVVSVMPCTAKKFEAARPEFTHDGNRRRGRRPHHAGTGQDDRPGRDSCSRSFSRSRWTCRSASRPARASSSARPAAWRRQF